MDFRKFTTYPLGMRNNNVGNVKNFDSSFYVGQVGKDNKGHAIFSDMRYGVATFANDVLYKIFARPTKLNTITKIVNVYAPASDGNNTIKYINFLSSKSGIAPNEILTKNKASLIKLLNAMGEYEVTPQFFKKIPQSDIDYGYNKAFNKYGVNAGLTSNQNTNSGVLGGVGLLAVAAAIVYVLKK